MYVLDAETLYNIISDNVINVLTHSDLMILALLRTQAFPANCENLFSPKTIN